jgi:hypothetical protein
MGLALGFVVMANRAIGSSAAPPEPARQVTHGSKANGTVRRRDSIEQALLSAI